MVVYVGFRFDVAGENDEPDGTWFWLTAQTGYAADTRTPDSRAVADDLGCVERDERAEVVGPGFDADVVDVFDGLRTGHVERAEAGQCCKQCGNAYLAHPHPPVIGVGVWPLSAGTSGPLAQALSLTPAV